MVMSYKQKVLFLFVKKSGCSKIVLKLVLSFFVGLPFSEFPFRLSPS